MNTYREKEAKYLTKKERRAIPLQPMPEQSPEIRKKDFSEVTLGYSILDAQYEAARCIQCKDPACVAGCPVGIDIPGFLEMIVEGNLNGSINRVWEKTALPAVCGRVCPQEIQCEVVCVVGKKKNTEPVGIGSLEMFIADWARSTGVKNEVEIAPSTGKKIAVVGSGPAGITVAGDLAIKGHDVTIYEAFHRAGGVLLYGIPEFRLAKDIVDYEIDQLRELGVKIICNTVVGRTVDVDELMEDYGYDAVFIGVGAGLPNFLNISGEDLNGVFSANEYLTRANLMKAFDFPKYDTPIIPGRNVAILGAGNVAMDAARTAVRLGAKTVTVVYRRTREQSPSRLIEIHHAEEEGVQFKFLTSPLEFIGDASGKLVGINCDKMVLGEPDEGGRSRPISTGEHEYFDCDLAIIAIGTSANPLLTRVTEGLELNRWGNIEADDKTGKTTKERVWAGGDITLGQATVILAMGMGRDSANSIDAYLKGEEEW
ncbi:NADPH-dependent glutamate synthase [Sulfurovum sp. bin170]|uniref:NADPH-dependent glutamate synthase n=1 Tax=Sulfurovum sp. bin170 TaxID=2695268 RepID=UPI0013DF2D00|nr:NADPH-dependent glutamate synthase [Sulfurovum sp. bin170]NEW59799.1 NADPH-dependent glutamate synthase [Sulfurovum sp. bin170]